MLWREKPNNLEMGVNDYQWGWMGKEKNKVVFCINNGLEKCPSRWKLESSPGMRMWLGIKSARFKVQTSSRSGQMHNRQWYRWTGDGYSEKLPEHRGAAGGPWLREEGWKRKWFVGEYDEFRSGPTYDLVNSYHIFMCISSIFLLFPLHFSLPFKFKPLLKNRKSLVFFDLTLWPSKMPYTKTILNGQVNGWMDEWMNIQMFLSRDFPLLLGVP